MEMGRRTPPSSQGWRPLIPRLPLHLRDRFAHDLGDDAGNSVTAVLSVTSSASSAMAPTNLAAQAWLISSITRSLMAPPPSWDFFAGLLDSQALIVLAVCPSFRAAFIFSMA